MSLSREFINLLFRTDLETILEQNLWTAVEQQEENHVNPMHRLVDVLKGRDRLGFLEGRRWERRHRGRTVSLPQKAPCGTEGRPGFDSQRLHPDLDAEEDWRPSHLNLVVDPLIGRLKMPARYRKDESDK